MNELTSLALLIYHFFTKQGRVPRLLQINRGGNMAVAGRWAGGGGGASAAIFQNLRNNLAISKWDNSSWL